MNETQNKCNLRSKQKEGKPITSNHPRKSDNPSKIVAAPNKGTK